jgi:hypothetical protein
VCVCVCVCVSYEQKKRKRKYKNEIAQCIFMTCKGNADYNGYWETFNYNVI